ncbi:hypothetical protein SAMN04487995_4595 [Dyadobacter koreensis]|uniref:PIN like domain-containing protein n=1 Tax=Dyadobacter koreensis TaxID=408657 RepID=A0A1H6YKI9_9BACT|nr:hypothetical protein [Dyadobacter koreensis]SEJ41838.1 hypothetical protein SAMN04487995_4595 [Dyadobacter koreensis]
MIDSILYSYGEPLSLSSIVSLIQDIFKINPNHHELTEAINFQLKESQLFSSDGKISLTAEKYLDLQALDIKSKEEQQSRFGRFKQIANPELQIDSKINKLWIVFNEYILDTFYQYGESAVNHFRLYNIDSDIRETNSYKNALEKLSQDERILFKEVVLKFTNSLSSQDIEYLDSLANKTVSFHSLGLPNDLHLEVIDKEIFNWVIFVDTNFLFSILNLHKHPENQAAHELIKLVNLSKLRIDFRYTPFTLKELKGQKSEFSNNIPKEKFTKSQISAMLRSGKLDSFSEAYYKNLLNNSEATLHPTEVIDYSEKTLQVSNITKFNSDFAKISEEYLEKCIGEYQHYINIINDAYQQRNSIKSIYKSEKQLHHDVFLREAILYLQAATKTNPENLSQKKYLGLTLDKLLIKYDKYELSKQSHDYVLPNFYLPSFLLKKLYQILPIETQDHKKAFVTAIATFTFFESSEKSKEVQKFVAYYRNMGLEDEDTLLSFITDEFFLNGFFRENIYQADFIESELNRRLKSTQQENNQLKSEKFQIERSERAEEDEIARFQEEIDHLKNIEKVYSASLKKVQVKREEEQRTSKNDLNIFDQIKRDDEVKRLEDEVLRLKKNEDKIIKLRREEFINKKMRKWRRDGLLYLFP